MRDTIQIYDEVSERFKVSVLKTDGGQAPVGSNPTLVATGFLFTHLLFIYLSRRSKEAAFAASLLRFLPRKAVFGGSLRGGF